MTSWTTQPTRLLCPWNSGKNTGVGSHSLLQGNLPDPGIEPGFPELQLESLLSEPPGKTPQGNKGSTNYQIIQLQPQESTLTSLFSSIPTFTHPQVLGIVAFFLSPWFCSYVWLCAAFLGQSPPTTSSVLTLLWGPQETIFDEHSQNCCADAKIPT